MNNLRTVLGIVGLVASMVISVAAQSGGNFTITKSVIAGGGGQSNGGTFTLDGTIGQSIAGTSSTGGTFELTGGFWGGVAAPVTSVSVSGRVFTPAGLFLRNAVVTMIDQNNVRVTTTTSSAGIFTFNNVLTGQTYIFTIASKRYRFSAQTLAVNGAVTNMEFFGLE